MIVVAGQFRLPLERRDEALAAMAKVIAASRAETGCIEYSYAEDVLDPGLFRVSEVWESREALAAHFAMPHMAEWQRVRAGLGLSERHVVAYTAGAPEVL